MNKKVGNQKSPKLAGQPMKTISSPIIPNSALVKSETTTIKVRSKAKTNSRIPEKDKTHSLSTFSIDSDTVSISIDSGISSGRTTLTASIAADHPKSKSASDRKFPIQEKLKKVSIPEVPKDFVVSKKKPSQIKSKPQQTQKKVEQTVSLDDRTKALQDRQNAL